MAKRTSDAIHAAFNQYIAYISDKAIRVHGESYDTYAELKNNWRFQFPYTTELEKWLVLETKVFLRLMPAKDTHNLGYLKSLINEIADFLSAYTMRQGNITRNDARQKIIYMLWDKNLMVQSLMLKQKQRQIQKQR